MKNRVMENAVDQATIMVIDDEPDNLNVLEAMLTQGGYRVSVFPRGDLALTAAQDKPPDLVLLDIRMPDMDGYEVCRRFKAVDKLCAIPILFASALSAVEDIAAGFAHGAVDYIAKPCRKPEVLARVRTHLALRDAYVKLDREHAQLTLLEHHRDTLTHMLVHDMRSPLQAIGGHLGMIAACGITQQDPDIHGNLQAALDGTAVLSQMVSTMIDLSRMEFAGIPLHCVELPLQDIFRAARARVHNPNNTQRIVERIAPDCPRLRCDFELGTRILANLLANAFKHSPTACEIVLGADPDPGGVRITVADQGPGIPEHFHDTIFEKYAVVAGTPEIHSSSTGLGLAFCKHAVEAHGGSIGVNSLAGQGSTFWFTLPAAAARCA